MSATEPEPSQLLHVRNFAFYVLATLALVVLLRYAQELFVPIVLSILIAYALNPFVATLEGLRIPRTLGAAFTVIALFAGVGFGVYALRQQTAVVLDSIPDVLAKVRNEIQEYRRSPDQSSNAIGKLRQAAKEIEETAAEATDTAASRGVPKVQIDQPAFRTNDFIWTGSLGLLSLVSNGVLVVFLVFFLLASGDLFKRKVVHLIGTRLSEKRMTLETLNEINAQIERFLFIQVLTSIAVGVCTAVSLWAFGLHQPAFWGSAAGVLSSLPYIGPIFITGALAIAAFVQFASMTAVVKIVAVPIVVFSLEGLLLKPAVMGKAARINGVAMFVGLLFWSWIWGLIGLIVAVPIMMALKSVCDRVESLRPIGELLDES